MKESIAAASKERFDEYALSIYENTDRLFAILMAVQWLGGIVIAFSLTPETWVGSESSQASKRMQ